LVYVDSQVVIYTVEAHPLYGPLLEPLWRESRAGQLEVISSELALMEVLVLPLRRGDTSLQADFEQALLGTDMRLLPITQPILREAAQLRASIPSLRTPDALHAATDRLSGTALFLSNDVGFRKVPGLKLIILDDLLGP
jgi:predicted nucleic acid-binding protein